MPRNLLDLDDATKKDLRTLLAKLMEYSEVSLLHCPGFVKGVQAFGASLDSSGSPGMAVAQLEGEPCLSDYQQALIKGFRGQVGRNEIRAAGYCFVGHEQLPGTAVTTTVVCAIMEHQSGVSVRVTIPYALEGPEKARFGESMIRAEQPCIFGTEA